MATVIIRPRGTHPATYQPNTDYDFDIVWTGGSTGFDRTSDISVVDGASQFLLNRGSGTYWYRVRTGRNAGGRTIITIRANAVTEGNTEYVYGFDYGTGPPVTEPVITLAFSDAEGQSGGTTTLRITADKDITGLAVTDFSVSNGSLSNLQGRGRSYTATLTFPAIGAGTTTVRLAEGSVDEGNALVEAMIAYVPPPLPPATGPPEFVAVAKQRILIDTPYRLPIRVREVPDWVRVRGLYEKDFSYDYQRAEGVVYIVGHPTREVSNQVWEVTGGNSFGTANPLDVEYDVVAPVPTITDIGRLTFWRGVPLLIHIPIDSFTSATVDGLLVGMGHERVGTGVNIIGTIPTDVEFTATEGTLLLIAKSSGGEDTHTFAFDLDEIPESGIVLQLGEVGAHDVTLNWQFVGERESDFTGWQIQVNAGGWYDIGNPAGFEYIIDGLKADTFYQFKVRGIRGTMPGFPSNLLGITTTLDVPEKIEIVYAGVIPGVPSKLLEIDVHVLGVPDKVQGVTTTILP